MLMIFLRLLIFETPLLVCRCSSHISIAKYFNCLLESVTIVKRYSKAHLKLNYLIAHTMFYQHFPKI